jgi:hypothetical protein
MAEIGHSAKLYQERREPTYRTTLRGPGPQLFIAQNAANYLKLEAPLPLPELLTDVNGHPPTDTGRTQVWPHGDKYAP